MTDKATDLGSGLTYTKFGWHPDRKLNPQYDGIEDDDWQGIILTHHHADGTTCSGGVSFNTPSRIKANALAVEKGFRNNPGWEVESWEPLTLSPSILQPDCPEGLHGYIREGKWVSC